MKILLIISLATLACSANININRPAYNLDGLRSRTLADDFKDIEAVIPKRQIYELFRRYLVGDAEFQRIILYFGSPDVINVGKLIKSQPEVKELYSWIEQQIISGQSNSFSDESTSNELYDFLSYKSSGREPLRGWKGFMEEFLKIYPTEQMCNLIREKSSANGIFTEFWKRVKALRPVYERILKLTEVRKVIDRLRELGVDTKQLGQIIRKDFVWEISCTSLSQNSENQGAVSDQLCSNIFEHETNLSAHNIL